jgi:hypothetical protein
LLLVHRLVHQRSQQTSGDLAHRCFLSVIP